jgi:hypothetical protein
MAGQKTWCEITCFGCKRPIVYTWATPSKYQQLMEGVFFCPSCYVRTALPDLKGSLRRQWRSMRPIQEELN